VRLIFKFIKKYWLGLLLIFITAFGFIIIELGLPSLLSNIINDGIEVNDYAIVWQYGIYMILIVISGTIARLFMSYLVSRIVNYTVRDIRLAVFKKTRSFSITDINHFGVSSLMTRTNNDAYQVMLFLQMALRVGFMTPIMLLSSIYVAINTSPALSSILLFAFPLLIIAIVVTAWVTAPIARRQQVNLDKMNRIMREGLTGLRVIRAFSREKFQQERFEDVNEAYTNESTKLFYFIAISGPAFGLLLLIVMLAVLLIGTDLITSGVIKIGVLVAFVEYIFHALFSVMMFAMLFTAYPRMAVSAERIQAVLSTENQLFSPKNGVTKTKKRGYLQFKDVSFAYHDDYDTEILTDISFEAKPGQVVAFIGSTGSGKSSIIKLIPRFQDVASGQVLIDGVDVRDYDLVALRKKIGYVPQKSLLFTGTVRDNLCFGDEDASEERLIKAAKVAQAYDFIMSKAEQFDYRLTEGGTNLSGGQRQRLAIARALVRQPEIYIFDDSFSALDYKTDAKLRRGLKGYTKNATILIVAQRVSTIRYADNIIVLDKGRIVAQGTHEELLKTSSVYYDIAASQLSKEELV